MSEPVCLVHIPARPEAIRVLRAVANSVAASNQMSFDRIEDLDLAIDEAGAALLDYGISGAVICEVGSDGDRLSVSMKADEVEGAMWPPPAWEESLSGIVLSSVAEQVRFASTDSQAHITFQVR